MATRTLLDMTQDILSFLNSDEVNSISDTTESLQVATIIKNKYYDIQSRAGMIQHYDLLQLGASTDSSKPTLMTIPAGVSKLEWIKYFDSNPLDGASLQASQFGSYSHDVNTNIVNTKSWQTTSTASLTIGTGTKVFTGVSTSLPLFVGQSMVATNGANQMLGTVTSYSGSTLTCNISSTVGSGTFALWTITSNNGNSAAPGYLYVTVLPIDQFLDQTNRFNPTDNDVRSFSFTELGNNFTFYYKNDHQPQFCTILSNQYVVFDMYDATQDTTLQSSKTMCYGQVVPVFNMIDSFIPSLTDQQFPLLMAEAKALAFYELKQMPHAKAEQEIKRQWSSTAKNKSIKKANAFDELPGFGRVPRTGGFSSGGYAAYKWMRQSGP